MNYLIIFIFSILLLYINKNYLLSLLNVIKGGKKWKELGLESADNWQYLSGLAALIFLVIFSFILLISKIINYIF